MNNIMWACYAVYAKKFYMIFGHINIPDDYIIKNSLNLGEWVQYNKIAYANKTLTDLQVTALENMCFNPSTICVSDNWDKEYKYARKYYAYYGNLNVPVNYKYSAFDLGKWLVKQSCANAAGLLSIYKIRKLNSLKFDYDKYNVPLDWLNKYNTLLGLLYKYNTENLLELKDRILKLRKNMESDNLSAVQIELLNCLNHFKVKHSKCNNSPSRICYVLAKKYYLKYGNLNIRRDFKTLDGINYDENGYEVGVWVYDIKKRKEQHMIKPQDYEHYNKIGFNFMNHEKFDVWEEKYQAVKGLGNIPDLCNQKITTLHTTFELKSWLTNQTSAYLGTCTTIMDAERIKKLESIGMEWFINNPKNGYEIKKTDEYLQKEEIFDFNLCQKKIELKNRVLSLLNEFDDNTMPSKAEIQNVLIKRLNYKKI